MDKEYLSVKDFATAAGVSKQAVYQRLNKGLEDYVKIIDDKKFIEKSALELFGTVIEKEQIKEESKVVEQELINALKARLEDQERSKAVEQELINTLKKQLEEKDKQIAEKDMQIKELIQSLSAAQELQKIEKAKVLQLEEKLMPGKDKEPEPVEVEVVDVSTSSNQEESQKKWWQFWK